MYFIGITHGARVLIADENGNTIPTDKFDFQGKLNLSFKKKHFEQNPESW